ncbi:hypothetical protein [Mesorhizobium sp. LNJC405B00]|uniref:capsid assembly protein n=1 Tax=Mesorhizobium sp. LNJC405B00 TaxID=1287281 RepID=UPI0003CE9877|nr:hypothetical protein [Mesorhizobium sp. LNJC405B00]ESX98700.1 hypothetical protein X755_15180 [Mesorhizobium sp. LNJC405B00]
MGGAVELNITSEATGPEAPVQTDRPDHIPEKFWDAETKSIRTEALLQSYGELEKKVGAPKEAAHAQESAAPEAEAEAEQEEDADQKAAKAAADAAGIGMDALQAEFDADGKLSDASYEKLDKAGFPKETVDDFIEYRKSKADGYVAHAHAAAGGADELTKMTAWAAQGYDAAKVKVFNDAVNSGDKNRAEQAIKALKADYVKAKGSPAKLINQGNAPQAGGDVYTSLQQMLADQAKPQYRADPAFREAVKQKLARSSI